MKSIQYQEVSCPKAAIIAVVVSRFHADITAALRTGAVEQLLAKGVSSANIWVVEVPGAVEIPIVAQRLAKMGRCTAIIALGAVIRGETSHYDYVCQQVSTGCQTVALHHDIPVIFKVLTTDNEAQAWDRLGGKHGHMGIEGADVALAMCGVLETLATSEVFG